jgi:hypothetical protein
MVDFEKQAHDLQEEGVHSFYGFESDAEDRMYNIDRWLPYLLDPGEKAEPVSEQYEEKTAALNIFGLHLADEILEMGEDATEDLEEYRDDIRELSSLGYTEEVRMYAEDILNQLEEN